MADKSVKFVFPEEASDYVIELALLIQGFTNMSRMTSPNFTPQCNFSFLPDDTMEIEFVMDGITYNSFQSRLQGKLEMYGGEMV